jgi:putative DNA primase/helicase
MTTAPENTTGSGWSGNIAQPWYDAGVSVVPILPGRTKKPSMDWKVLQSVPLTADTVARLWGPGRRLGVAAICGKVSGALEMTELESDAASGEDLDRIGDECSARGVRELWDTFLSTGYSEYSPSGGIHLLYRITDHEVPGNAKLAMRLATFPELSRDEQDLLQRNPGQKFWRTRAETRGEGGYVVVAPTPGYCHGSGLAWEVLAGQVGVIPEITWEQRCELHEAIHAALDQTPPPEPAPAVEPGKEIVVVRSAEGELRPGDDWNNKADWNETWFTGAGWTISHRVGAETFWVRPGKNAKDGHSASTGYNGDKDRLYVWSTSAGLPTEKPLDKFYVYSHYHHSGSMKLASAALRRQGYGDAPASYAVTAFNEDGRAEVVESPVPGNLDLTDTGSGRRMKSVYGNRFRRCPKEKAWYEWTGEVWKRDEHLAIWRAAVHCAELAVKQAGKELEEAETGGVKEEIASAKRTYASAQALKNKGKIEAAMDMFASEPGMQVMPEDFDADRSLLNLPNGTLDLVSGHVIPHDPANMLTLTMGASHDKDAEAPRFRQFMEEVFPNDNVRAYMQRCMGYSLLGRPTERTMFLLHGPSGTGKSVFTSVMTSVFGSYGATAPASTFQAKKQSDTLDLHKLKGARFVATSELPEGAQLNEDLVKRITGNDIMTSRGHYETFTEWKPSCVIWIATNFLPKFGSDDGAIWRRTKSIPMTVEFGGRSDREETRGLSEILAQEADGILNWMLEGLEAYRFMGELGEPPEITADIEAYRVEMTMAASFIRDKIEEGAIVEDPVAETKSSHLRSMFDHYCAENQLPKLGARRFQNQLKTMGYEPIKIGGHAWWKGLRIDLEYGVLGTIRS